jgi:hypothetical protein
MERRDREMEAALPAAGRTLHSQLRSLLLAAERLTVGDISQAPEVANVSDPNPSRASEIALREGFTWMPIQEPGGIRRMIRGEDLLQLTSWKQLDAVATAIEVHHLVPRDAGLFSILDRFSEEQPILFCLGSAGIDGVVTLWDLNQPAARMLALGLVLVVEGEIGRTIHHCLATHHADVDAAVVALTRAPPRIATPSVRRWKAQRRRSDQTSLLRVLGLGEKLHVLDRAGCIDRFAAQLGDAFVDAKELRKKLNELVELRDDVAHSKPGLQDSVVVWRRMGFALELAERLVAAGSSNEGQ